MRTLFFADNKYFDEPKLKPSLLTFREGAVNPQSSNGPFCPAEYPVPKEMGSPVEEFPKALLPRIQAAWGRCSILIRRRPPESQKA